MNRSLLFPSAFVSLSIVVSASGCDSTGTVSSRGPRDGAADAQVDSGVLPVGTATQEAGAPACGEADAAAVGASTCDRLCGAVGDAGCVDVPPRDECLNLCRGAIARCPGRVAALVACLGPSPAFSCDATGNAASTACAGSLACVRACVASAGDGG